MSSQSKQSTVFFAGFAAMLLIAHQIAAKAARDGLFLGTYGAEWLPQAMMGAALVSLGSALLSARAMRRWGARHVLVGALGFSGSAYLVEWLLLERAREGVAVALYLHVAALGATLIATFWTMLSEQFDPRSGKKKIARIAAGGTLGGVIGGLLSWLVGEASGVRSLLLMLALLNVIGVMAIVRAASSRTPRRNVSGESTSELGASNTQRALLVRLGMLVGLVAAISALLDYALGARAAATFRDENQLAVFFAMFHMGVGVLAFVLQTALARPVLERWGLVGTIGLLPAMVVTFGIGALFLPSLITTLVVRGAEGVIRGSVYRSGYELVYTPLATAPNHSEKVIIDVAVDRVGTIGGSALAALAVVVAGQAAPEVTMGLAIGAAVLAVLTLPGLHRGYVDALARRLRTGTLALSAHQIVDATTRQTLTETASFDRTELLRAIEAARTDAGASKLQIPVKRLPDEHPTSLTAADAGFDLAPASLRMMMEVPEDLDPVLRQAVELRSGVAERVRHVFQSAPLSVELVGHIIPLLGDDEIAREALAALQDFGPRITGQLGDALCDRTLDAKVRRRLPRTLEASSNNRAVEALTEALFDEAFDVRYQSALSLARLTSNYPELGVPRDRIIAAAIAELGRGSRAWERYVASDAEADSPLFDVALRARTGRGVELVMSMLALILEREPLRLACRALFSDDAGLRGTALEYLDNVLPEPIKRAGMPFLDELDRAQRRHRTHPEVVAELLKSGEVALSAFRPTDRS